jgi:hypothetical protein
MNREELLKNTKPILFNTQMVQAILEGRKAVTRRIIKPQPNNIKMLNGVFSTGLLKIFYDPDRVINIKAPYEVGDTLYVREKFNDEETDSVLYAADKEFTDFGMKEVDGYMFVESEVRWKPSIHMPKSAARIFLKVTDVRVERLQDITEEQAYKEGTTLPSPRANYVNSFMEIWLQTIKENDIDKFGVEANPWVWVIEFERVKV